MTDNIIPENEQGAATNTESEYTCASENEAAAFFREVRKRLFQVNRWQELAGKATAAFRLTDAEGNPVNREPAVGDHFEIDIPGPPSQSGEGHDWVRVEAVEETENGAAIRVRPAPNPRNDKSDVAHFFSGEATSSFMVERTGKTVKAGVYGRNEKPNTRAEGLADTIRNTAMAAGAISGFSKIQWKSLVNGLVKREEES